MSIRNTLILSLVFLSPAISIFSEKREMIRMFKKEPQAFVFGDKVNLRAEPNKESKIVSVLSIGTELKIGEIIEAPSDSDEFAWIQAETQDGKKGFVYETLITVHILKLAADKFLYLGIVDGEIPKYELRLVSLNRLLAKLTLPKKYKNYITFERLKTKFVSPPYFVAILDSTGNACGEPIYSALIQVKHDSIILALQNTGYVDGDLGLFYDYKIRQDNSDKLIITEIEDHVIDNVGKKYRHQEKRTTYEIQGDKLKRLSRKKRNFLGPHE